MSELTNLECVLIAVIVTLLIFIVLVGCIIRECNKEIGEIMQTIIKSRLK